MRRRRWFIYLWPGLCQLWLRGSWFALAVALAAAALLNLALLGSFGWTELFSGGALRALWLMLGAAWVGWAAMSLVGSRRQRNCEPADPAGDDFEKALEHYLKGNWFQAERLLSHLLRRSERDLEARLTLAALLRHTGRLEEAGTQLDLLARFEGAQKWEWEIRRERELLSQSRAPIDGEDEEQKRPGSTHPPADMTHAA